MGSTCALLSIALRKGLSIVGGGYFTEICFTYMLVLFILNFTYVKLVELYLVTGNVYRTYIAVPCFPGVPFHEIAMAVL